MSALIFEFFEEGVKTNPKKKKIIIDGDSEEEDDTSEDPFNLFYMCKHCGNFYSSSKGSNTNLHKHIRISSHKAVLAEYDAKMKEASPRISTSAQLRFLVCILALNFSNLSCRKIKIMIFFTQTK